MDSSVLRSCPVRNVAFIADFYTDIYCSHKAKGIAGRIEAELRYPGRIKVVIIRETRAMEYAK